MIETVTCPVCGDDVRHGAEGEHMTDKHPESSEWRCPDCNGPMVDGLHQSPFAACLYEDDDL